MSGPAAVDLMGLTDVDRDIARRAAIFADELIPYEVEAELAGGHLPHEIVEAQKARVRELGLASMTLPHTLGGTGMTMLQQVLVSEQIGRVTNALGWALATPGAWMADVASDFQIQRWVLPTARGEAAECYAITEEGAGSDVDAIASTVTREGDSYVLRGVKWHVTSFSEASYLLFQGKLTEGPHAGEHALLFVDKDTPGVRVERTPAYTHTYAHDHPIVAFDDVRVPTSHLVGAEGDGLQFTYEWFRYERLMIAARCIGAAARLIDEAARFAQQRMVAGSRIFDHQSISFPLADSTTELWAARLMTYQTAREIDAGVDVKLSHAHCSMVKLYASEMAYRAADRAVQTFGGRGYMRENVAERFLRELRVDRIWEGTSEVQRSIIARALERRGIAVLTGDQIREG